MTAYRGILPNKEVREGMIEKVIRKMNENLLDKCSKENFSNRGNKIYREHVLPKTRSVGRTEISSE